MNEKWAKDRRGTNKETWKEEMRLSNRILLCRNKTKTKDYFKKERTASGDKCCQIAKQTKG